MKKAYYDTFIKYLDQENKDKSVEYVMSLLKSKSITLEECYLNLLSASLSNFVCKEEDEDLCIWKEHTRTSIVRTILEATYPYVIERKNAVSDKKKSVVVVCPSEEYHEIGAIIVSHYFAMNGYESLYIGANTPKNDIVSAVKVIQPDILAISVTNYYNLVVTKKITQEVKQQFPHVKIVVGGLAFHHPDSLSQIVYDKHLTSLDDIAHIEEELQ
ncbi:MAG: cobalamin B12-binding domain-containing protein [Candidatus Izemoplasmatales bacterium]|nr:cobalamin B12-binding domain-containing protein [Candidatus Izemoplasmatales bacterium]